MVKHVIIWTLKDEYSNAEELEIKMGIKQGLEGLKGRIDGLIDIKVYTEPLSSSNTDLLLDSTFESVEALNAYSVHPDHMEVALSKVRPYVAIRSCMDYEVTNE